ncbi:MAG: peptidase S10 [Myxococcota bacterium]|nr:peptidase S10 [Myxococcota bacterium]
MTHHERMLGSARIGYEARAETLVLREEPAAEIFVVSYLREPQGDPTRRPVTFMFNGGPGSSSVWLHLGAFGPRRVAVPDAVQPPPPPVRLVDNEHALLEWTDLVFVDPVGTGYSRAAGNAKNEDFWGIEPDLRSLTELVRLWITRNGRWASPKFLAGESYGTFRVAGLLERLQERGVFVNGALFVSPVLDVSTVDFDPRNDLAAALYLPSYAAAAHYHGLLPAGRGSLDALIHEVTEFALGPYTSALLRGSRLAAATRAEIVEALHRYTGLERDFIERVDLRVEIQRFCRELLRRRGRIVGRLDARYAGIDVGGVDAEPEHDPSYTALLGPFTAAMHHYVRHELGFEEDRPYEVLNEKTADEWRWDTQDHVGYPLTAPSLRKVMATNTHLEVLFACGIYDLATPFLATDYTIDHLGLPAEAMSRIHVRRYEAGHMMYVHPPSLQALQRDVVGWMTRILER